MSRTYIRLEAQFRCAHWSPGDSQQLMTANVADHSPPPFEGKPVVNTRIRIWQDVAFHPYDMTRSLARAVDILVNKNTILPMLTLMRSG